MALTKVPVSMADADVTQAELDAVSAVASAASTKANAAAVDADVVHKTGNETIEGVKTFTSVPGLPAPSRVILNTANGYGSTNTAIRRFTNVEVNSGADITYADSATLGASFTINTTGLYSISYADSFTAASAYHGVSANSTQLTTSIGTITPSTVLTVTGDSAGNYGTCAAVLAYITAGAVLRPHCTPGIATGGFASKFNITRVY